MCIHYPGGPGAGSRAAGRGVGDDSVEAKRGGGVFGEGEEEATGVTAGGKTLGSRSPASGESATTRARGCPGWDRGAGAGRGRRLQVATKGCGGEGRPETRENSAAEPPEPRHLRPPPPASAPPRRPPGPAPRGRLPGGWRRGLRRLPRPIPTPLGPGRAPRYLGSAAGAR